MIEIYCANCKKRYLVLSDKFRELVEKTEADIEEISMVLVNEDLPVDRKNHDYINSILTPLMRCCLKPEIYVDFDPKDYDGLKEKAKKHFEGSRYTIIKEDEDSISFTIGSGIGKTQTICLRLLWDSVNYIQRFNYMNSINYTLDKIEDIVIPSSNEEFENLVMRRKPLEDIE